MFGNVPEEEERTQWPWRSACVGLEGCGEDNVSMEGAAADHCRNLNKLANLNEDDTMVCWVGRFLDASNGKDRDRTSYSNQSNI